MSLHFAVPTFLLPLWIIDHTNAPRWMVSGAFVLNTIMVVGLQVIVSRGVHTVAAAGVRMRWAGLALLASLALIAFAAGPSPLIAAILLLAGMAIYTLGELWHAAAAMEYMFGMAAPHAQGQYAGVFGLGGGLAEALAPSVLAFLCLELGRPGWIILGLIFLAVGAGSTRLISFATNSSTPKGSRRDTDHHHHSAFRLRIHRAGN